METVTEFIKKTKGNAYDIDKAYGAQCWDYFAYFARYFKLNINTYCALTGYAGDLWKLRDKYNYKRYFDYVTDINDLKDGDWIFWDQHVALYYAGQQWGQRQGGTGVTGKKLTRAGFLGALRFKGWATKKTKGTASMYSKALTGQYITTAAVNLRTGPGTDYEVLKVLPKNTKFTFWGYFGIDRNGRTWYYISADDGLGFICSDYLKRV